MAVVWFSDVAMEWIWTNTLAADTQVVFVSMLFVTLWISVHCGSALIGQTPASSLELRSFLRSDSDLGECNRLARSVSL